MRVVNAKRAPRPTVPIEGDWHWRAGRGAEPHHAYRVLGGAIDEVAVCGQRRGRERRAGSATVPPVIFRCMDCWDGVDE